MIFRPANAHVEKEEPLLGVRVVVGEIGQAFLLLHHRADRYPGREIVKILVEKQGGSSSLQVAFKSFLGESVT